MGRRRAAIHTFVADWADAERRGDVTVLGEMVHARFVGVAEDGQLLDKPAWIQRYRSGDLVHDAFFWQTAHTRSRRRAALVVGHLDQISSYRGQDAAANLTASLALVSRRGRWQLLGFHASPSTC